jgi:hypothetical protein
VDKGIKYFWNTSSKLQNALICQDNFSENYFTSSQKTRFRRCGVPSPSVVRSKFTVSQNNSFSRQIQDLMTMETTEQVVIPDPAVIPERAHSSKFAGQMLQLFQSTKVRELNPRETKIYYMNVDER